MLLVLASVLMTATTLTPTTLECEALVNPMGMDVEQPRLSWRVESTETGQRQSAYRILVASDKATLQKGTGDLWDSGKVAGDQTINIPYAGKPLKSAQRVFWNVQVWDKDGIASRPSETATWTMGLLKASDWKAKWIGAFDRPLPRKGIGYHALEAKTSLDETKWVQIDLGESERIDHIVLYPVRNHYEYPIFGFPIRFSVDVSDDKDFKEKTTLYECLRRDFEGDLSQMPLEMPTEIKARYLRITATKLWARKDGVGCFALAEVEVYSGDKNIALGKPVAHLDSVEQSGWTHEALVDGSGTTQDLPITLFMRKEEKLAKPVSRATAFVSGLGQYELRINGKRVGENWITPGWTQYQKSILVDSYDVTDLLKKGGNALALHIGNGMYNMETDSRGAQQQNSLGTHMGLLQIMVEHPDGTKTTLATNETWGWAKSPNTYSGVFGGEDWDARLEPVGWDEPGFEDYDWEKTIKVTQPKAQLRGVTHSAPPIRVIETRRSVKSSYPKPNLLVLDLGQNAPYIPEVTVQGAKGAKIRMWPAEILKEDGTIEQKTMRAGKHCSYTLRGGTAETWQPSFWYCGSRYWQIDAFDPAGKPIDPKVLLKDFRGNLAHSDLKPVGTFECSNELLNQIYPLIRWAIRSNFCSVISDCPHREKSGWLEEYHLMGPSLMYCYDLRAMYRKGVSDMRDTQLPSGMVPTMAPEYFIYEGGFRDSVEWGGASIFVPRLMRDWYNDQGLIGGNYDVMKRYVDYLGTIAKDDILSTGLGDWTGYGNDPRTPVAITDTCYYYLAVKSVSEFAALLGKAADAKQYGDLSERIRSKFLAAHFDPATGKVGNGSQSGQSSALDLGLIPAEHEAKAFEQLLKDVAEHEYAVSLGEIGHPSLLRVLAKNGRSDLVSKIHLQTEKPGYGYQLKKGMTSLAEAWDASPISLNHFMMGHLMEWLYADLVGIRPDAAGYKSAIIRPQPVPEVTWAKGSYDSIHGKYMSSWKIEAGKFVLDVDVPANCSATVYMPGQDVQVTQRASGKAFGAVNESGYKLTSGQFRLISTLGQLKG